MSQKGLLLDFTRCIGCGACERACAEQNQLPLYPPDDRLNYQNYTVVLKAGGQYFRRMCMHCLNPTCVSVCPVGALEKTLVGAVIYHPERCIGCRYCMMACPFNIPKYEWDKPTPVISKCILCYDRVRNGDEPACAWVCPTGACRFGDRERLMSYARRRLASFPDRYIGRIYGERELGGTSVLMLSGIQFADMGFRTDFGDEPLPELTWRVMSKIPNIVITGGLILGGLSWIIHRRMDIEQEHLKMIMEMEQLRRRVSGEGGFEEGGQ